MANYSGSEYTFEGLNVQYGLGLAFNMAGKYPAITKRIFDTKAMAESYINNVDDSAVAGLTVTVIADGDNNGVYFVKSIGNGETNGVLEKLGSSQGTSDVMSAVTNLQSAVGASSTTAITEALTGTTAGDATSVVNALNKLDDALKAVQDGFLTGITVNNVTGTVANNVASVTIGASDIAAGVAVGSKEATASVQDALGELDSMVDALSGTSEDTSGTTSVVGAKKYADTIVSDAKDELKGDSTTATSGDTTIEGAKKYADEKIAEATADLAVSAAGDTLVSAAVDTTDNKKINVSATEALTAAVDNANSALQSIGKGTDGSYLTTTVSEKGDGTTQTVSVSATVQSVSDASETKKGLAEASDVKSYVDAKASSSKTVVSKVEGSFSGLTITPDTTATDGHTDYKVSLTDVASKSVLDAELEKVAASKTLDTNYELTASIKYVPATTNTAAEGEPSNAVAAHIALVDEDNTELSSVAVSDLIGNGILKSSSYDKETGILTLTFSQADGTDKDVEVNLTDMLDINDMSISADSTSYLHVKLDGGENAQAVFAALVTAVSADTKGLADSKDVKAYVDKAVADKNVDAEGDTLVSATAEDNKVTVTATTALTTAVANANSALQEVSATGDSYVSAAFADKTGADGAKSQALTVATTVQTVSSATETAKGLAEASDVKAFVEKAVSDKNVDATGDTFVSATASNNKVTVAATESTKASLALADSAVQGVTKGTDGDYVTTTVGAKGADNKQSVAVSVAVQTVSTATAATQGLADAYDVKTFVEQAVADKNVDAEGDTLVSATAENNKVTVAATEALETAVANANSALQAIENGTDGDYVTTTVGTKGDNKQAVSVALTVQAMESASATAKGLAEASDVKAYVDGAAITAATFNDVTGTIEDNALSFEVDGGDIEVGEYTPVTYNTAFTAAQTSVTAVAEDDTLNEAINKVENAVSALVEEVLKNEETVAASINAIAEGAGLTKTDGEITYASDDTRKYISGATSLYNADQKLNDAIGALNTKVDNMNTAQTKAIEDAIDALDVTDTAVAKNFVTYVTEENGKITVHRGAITSTAKTVSLTDGADGGVNLEVNIDNKTLITDTNGVIGVAASAITVSGDNAISAVTGDSGTTVKLLLDADSDATSETGVKLSQTTSGLKAELNLNDAASTATTGGVGLALDADKNVKATLYWGEF